MMYIVDANAETYNSGGSLLVRCDTSQQGTLGNSNDFDMIFHKGIQRTKASGVFEQCRPVDLVFCMEVQSIEYIETLFGQLITVHFDSCIDIVYLTGAFEFQAPSLIVRSICCEITSGILFGGTYVSSQLVALTLAEHGMRTQHLRAQIMAHTTTKMVADYGPYNNLKMVEHFVHFSRCKSTWKIIFPQFFVRV
jgi:hypothetical protein